MDDISKIKHFAGLNECPDKVIAMGQVIAKDIKENLISLSSFITFISNKYRDKYNDFIRFDFSPFR